jgi:hypothetical protein
MKTRKFKQSYLFVVEGETEIWYFQMLKRNEKEIIKNINLVPEIPTKKSIEEQYEIIIKNLNVGYDKIFWIVDLDKILENSNKTKKGNLSDIEKFKNYRTDLINKKVIVVVNNPCLEFWFLLHFKYTSKSFKDCDDLQKELKKHLKDYKKTEKYYTKNDNDIYLRLKEHLNTALENSKKLGEFDPKTPHNSVCEMYKVFNELRYSLK